MKKKNALIASSVVAMATMSAHANGFYITPKVAWSQMRIEESRTEKKWDGTQWAEFNDNKHENWSGNGYKISPKIAIGYDFDAGKYGIFGLATEFGATRNHFNPTDTNIDFDGSVPNDSDTRDFTYTESTLALNAKYGYKMTRFTPFVTAGIGYSLINSENNFRSGTYWWETRDEARNMSWNIGAGIEIPVSASVAATLEYRYTDFGDVKYTNRMYHENAKQNNNGIERNFDSKVNLSKHEVMAGVKFSF